MKNAMILVFGILGAIKLDAQDTLVFRNNNIEIGKIVEVSRVEIKYKKISNLEGPVFVISKSELSEVRYQDGTKEITADPKYRFKLYNPYVYFLFGENSGSYSSSGINYLGIGHDGLFKFFNIRNNRMNIGMFYSLNILYGEVEFYRYYNYYGTMTSRSNYLEILNPYGLQLDFGKDNFRVVFQGMIGPTFSNYHGDINNDSFGIAGGFGFGFKAYKSKFGFRILDCHNDIMGDYLEIALRYGLEF